MRYVSHYYDGRRCRRYRDWCDDYDCDYPYYRYPYWNYVPPPFFYGGPYYGPVELAVYYDSIRNSLR